MANLRSLSLLRNDPDEAAQLLEAAEQGDLDAQYAMGLCYAEGRGVDQDEARSFVWLTLAHEQGDDDALVLRNIVAASMSDAQFEQIDVLLEAQRQKNLECQKKAEGLHTEPKNTSRSKRRLH